MASAESNSFGLFTREFSWRYWRHFIGTATTWFLIDIAFYSQNHFQRDIFSGIRWIPKAKTMNAILEEVFRIARTYVHRSLRDCPWLLVHRRAHRKRSAGVHHTDGGVLGDDVFMLGLAMPYNLFIVMYGFTFFFANFRLNITTFIMPAEIFPARLRSTCHGISVVTGKLEPGGDSGVVWVPLYLEQSPDKAKVGHGYSTTCFLQPDIELNIRRLPGYLKFVITWMQTHTADAKNVLDMAISLTSRRRIATSTKRLEIHSSLSVRPFSTRQKVEDVGVAA